METPVANKVHGLPDDAEGLPPDAVGLGVSTAPNGDLLPPDVLVPREGQRLMAEASAEENAKRATEKANPKWLTAGMHAIQGAAQNFGDEISGASEATQKEMQKTLQRFAAMAGGPALARQVDVDPSRSFSENYRTARDNARAGLDESERANPKTALLSSIGGGVAVPLPKIGTGAGVVSKYLLPGMILGGTNAAGRSTATDAGGLLKDTAIGTGVGGLASVAVGAPLGWALEKGGKALQSFADRRFAKAMNPYYSAAFKEMAEKSPSDNPMQKFEELARFARENGMVSGGDSAKNIASKVAAGIEGSDAKRLAGLAALDTTKGAQIRPESIADDLFLGPLEKAKDSGEGELLEAALGKKIDRFGNQLRERNPFGWSLPQAEAQKIKLSGKVNWSNAADQATNVANREAAQAIRRRVEQEAAERAASAGPAGKRALESFLGGKEDLSKLIPLQDVLEEGLAKNARNNFFSPRDWFVGGAGAASAPGLAMSGHPVAAGGMAALSGLMALGSKLSRERGDSTVGALADNAGSVLNAAGGVSAKVPWALPQLANRAAPINSKLAEYFSLLNDDETKPPQR